MMVYTYYSKRKHLLLLIFILLQGVSVVAQKDTVTFMTHWLPQAQFAGYYMAQKQGFYEEEDINVCIKHPSATSSPSEELLKENSNVDIISLYLAAGIELSIHHPNVHHIGQILPHSSLLFVSKKEANINTLKALKGKRIAIWSSGFDETPKAIVSPFANEVEFINIHSNISLFVLGGVDVMTVMRYNEYDQLINAGINPEELNIIDFAMEGYNIPEDALFCTTATLAKKGDAIKRFLQATAKGWAYTKTHPEETLEEVMKIMKEHNISANYVHQKWMLTSLLDVMQFHQNGLLDFSLSPESFEKTVEVIEINTGKAINLNYENFTSLNDQ